MQTKSTAAPILALASLFVASLILACQPAVTAPTTYTLTYDANGATGTAPSDGNAYEEFDAVTVTTGAGSMAKSGYQLAGWMTAVDGTGTSYAPGTVLAMGQANVTLYAVWVPDTYVVGGSGSTLVLAHWIRVQPTGAVAVPAGITALTSTAADSVGAGAGSGGFNSCAGITSIELPRSLAYIGPWSFGSCSGISSISIPESVTGIDDASFYSCATLSSIVLLPTTPPLLGNSVFIGLPTGFQIKVPAASVATYQAAPGWSAYAANIVSQ